MMFEENITTTNIYNNLEPEPEPQTTNKQTNKTIIAAECDPV